MECTKDLKELDPEREERKKRSKTGASQVVQWLRPCIHNAVGLD